MNPYHSHIARTRREFLTTSASGLGGIALGSMLSDDGVLNAATASHADQLAALRPHNSPKAKACIFIFMAGAPSHIDLFDPKPKLNELHGQKDLLPNLGSCADDLLMVRSLHSEEFNHHPGQLLMQCGVSRFGMPAMGSWINYGLGSTSKNLPGYVVLTAGRGSSGGATLWQSGFLPSNYSGVLFRNSGEPVLNLKNPNGESHAKRGSRISRFVRRITAHA